MPDWNASVYDQLSGPQQSWGEAVLARLAVDGGETVIDLGCGTGRLTERVLERLPRGRVIAVDYSPAMLEVARANLRPRFPGRVTFVRADAAAPPFEAAADVVFSTATFHWVLDHDALFRGVFAALRPGGRLVAQAGGGPNLARLLARAQALVESPAYAACFDGWHEPWLFEAADEAAARLAAAGFVNVEASTHPAPVTFATAGEYEDFLACVCVRHHIAQLPVEAQAPFVKALSAAAARDDPPFTLDYWRLNLGGRRPEA
jgi:trans-aconitate 2-methyltransferase